MRACLRDNLAFLDQSVDMCRRSHQDVEGLAVLDPPNHPGGEIGGDNEAVSCCTLEFRSKRIQHGRDRPCSENFKLRGVIHGRWRKRDRQSGERRDGIEGLRDRSRAPKSCPHRVDSFVEQLLIEPRRKHPTWGPKKLLPWLARRYDIDLPSRSTAGEILRRAGLCEVHRRRRRLEHPGKPTTKAATPNALWAADFKGEFLARDGTYC